MQPTLEMVTIIGWPKQVDSCGTPRGPRHAQAGWLAEPVERQWLAFKVNGGMVFAFSVKS
jgi:hypothetical protein